MATLEEAKSTMLKRGAKRVNNVVVNNVTVKECENYTRIALTLDKPVEGYVDDGNGGYVKGETNVIFVSLFSIAAMMRENDELACIVNELVAHPHSLEILLSRSTISLIQEPVKAGEVRVNPFTEKEDESVPDHDCIFNHITDVKLGKMGEIGLEKIVNKMLGV